MGVESDPLIQQVFPVAQLIEASWGKGSSAGSGRICQDIPPSSVATTALSSAVAPVLH
jgi:hypothetical protein